MKFIKMFLIRRRQKATKRHLNTYSNNYHGRRTPKPNYYYDPTANDNATTGD